MNGSRKEIDTLFPDSLRFFELLAMLVDEEPLDSFGPLERSMMQAIGIEKGKPFAPDAAMKALLSEAARLGGAMARANTYDSPAPGIYYYPDRKWQAVPSGMTYKFERDGAPQIDARNNVYYMAAGNSPAMMEKNVGQGSQYLWTYRDAAGEYLDGAKNYRLHILPDDPGEEFLVGGRVRRAQPVRVAERTAVAVGQQLRQPSRQRRRISRYLLWPEAAEGEGQLDPDGSGQGVVSDLSLLWPRRAVLRQDLEAQDIVAVLECNVGDANAGERMRRRRHWLQVRQS